MREHDEALLSHVNQMRVQQCKHSRVLVVPVPIFIAGTNTKSAQQRSHH